MAWLIIPRSVSIVPNRSSSSVPTQRLGIDLLEPGPKRRREGRTRAHQTSGCRFGSAPKDMVLLDDSRLPACRRRMAAASDLPPKNSRFYLKQLSNLFKRNTLSSSLTPPLFFPIEKQIPSR